jgi:hypothetical protein
MGESDKNTEDEPEIILHRLNHCIRFDDPDIIITQRLTSVVAQYSSASLLVRQER